MITCEKLTKCRDGSRYVSDWSHSGWLSTGVEPPDRSCSTTITRMISSANCAMEREIVPRKTPSAVAKNKYRTTPKAHKVTEPANGTCSTVRTMMNNDIIVAIRI